MPILEFEFEDTGEIVEEIFMPWEDLPQQIERDGRVARRIISVPGSGRVPNARLAALAKQGIVPVEAGMDRDVERAKKYRDERVARRRRKAVETIVSDALTTTLHTS